MRNSVIGALLLCLCGCSDSLVFLNQGEQNEMSFTIPYGAVLTLKNNTKITVHADVDYVFKVIKHMAETRGHKIKIDSISNSLKFTYVSDKEYKGIIRKSVYPYYAEIEFPEEPKLTFDLKLRLDIIEALEKANYKTNPHSHVNAIAFINARSKKVISDKIEAFFSRVYSAKKVEVLDEVWHEKNYRRVLILKKDLGNARVYDVVYFHIKSAEKDKFELHLSSGEKTVSSGSYSMVLSSKEESQALLDILVKKLV